MLLIAYYKGQVLFLGSVAAVHFDLLIHTLDDLLVPASFKIQILDSYWYYYYHYHVTNAAITIIVTIVIISVFIVARIQDSFWDSARFEIQISPGP